MFHLFKPELKFSVTEFHLWESFMPGGVNIPGRTMKLKAELDYGALQVEIWTEEGEDHQKHLRELLEFIGENKELLKNIGAAEPETAIQQYENEMASEEPPSEGTEPEEPTAGEAADDSLAAIASKLRDVAVEDLQEVIMIDNNEEMPLLYLEDTNLLGEKKTDRQRNASLILLYLWKKQFEVERVKSSKLKDALNYSNISESAMANMYQGEGNRYFDRGGRGPSATVALTPPGERQARKSLKNLVDNMKSDGSENGETTGDAMEW